MKLPRLFRVFLIHLALLPLLLSGTAHAQDKIRLGLLPFSESLGAVMADKLGFFKDENIDVEISLFNSGAISLPLIQAGKLDIALSNTISTLQVMEQGMNVSILAPAGVIKEQAAGSTSALMMLKGAMKSPKELEGKRIGVNVINSSAWLYVMAYLDKYGVDPNKVRFLEIPFPQMNAPLLNGQIDLIFQAEPFVTVLKDSGKVDVLGDAYSDVQPNGEITQYLAQADWVKSNPDLARRFVRAVRKGSEYVNSAADQASIRETNMQFTHLNPELKDRVPLPKLGIAVNLPEMRKTQDLMLKYGLMKKPVAITDALVPIK